MKSALTSSLLLSLFLYRFVQTAQICDNHLAHTALNCTIVTATVTKNSTDIFGVVHKRNSHADHMAVVQTFFPAAVVHLPYARG